MKHLLFITGGFMIVACAPCNASLDTIRVGIGLAAVSYTISDSLYQRYYSAPDATPAFYQTLGQPLNMDGPTTRQTLNKLATATCTACFFPSLRLPALGSMIGLSAVMAVNAAGNAPQDDDQFKTMLIRAQWCGACVGFVIREGDTVSAFLRGLRGRPYSVKTW